MSCRICGRPVEEGVYCSRHGQAYRNLEQAYLIWRYALGYTWVEYLERVKKTAGTGKWAKQTIDDIIQ
jgi:hypothetical protein